MVGGGAAGLFCAGLALSLGHKVSIIEHMEKCGKKLAITGKGRCNLTNNCDEAEFLKNVRHNPRFLYSAIYAFPPKMAMQWFEETLGIALKTERGRRVFPQSDSAELVVKALLQKAKGASMVRGRAKALVLQNGAAAGVLLEDKTKIAADAVLVATGGVSYPTTGASGDGYKLAAQVGHSIVPPVPSLVAMVEKRDIAKRMAGLSLKNVRLSLLQNGKQIFTEQGEMLFTHFGISGPLVLSASAYLADMAKFEYAVSIDLKPALDEQTLDARILRDFGNAAAKDASHCLDKLLPQSMRPVMLDLWGVPPNLKVGQINREQRAKLLGLIKNFKIEIAGRGSLKHAVITAGGVKVDEVAPKTMQSRLVKNLYFAGEVLDVDAYTGGYNLQIAWATAFAVANAI